MITLGCHSSRSPDFTDPSFKIWRPVYKLDNTARGHYAALGRHFGH